MMEQACTRVRFEGFAVVHFTAATDKSDPHLRQISEISGTSVTKHCKRHGVLVQCECDPLDYKNTFVPFGSWRKQFATCVSQHGVNAC